MDDPKLSEPGTSPDKPRGMDFGNLAYSLRDFIDCASEPLAFCGAIQPFGLLIAARSDDLVIQAVSANWTEVAGIERADSLIGRGLQEVLAIDPPPGSVGSGDLRQKLLSGASQVTVRDGGQGGFKPGVCRLTKSHLIIEFEVESKSEVKVDVKIEANDSLPLLQRLSRDVTTADSVQSAASATVALLREFTGYDRVMIYRFDPHWNGEVIAESVRGDMKAFLNLRFPASDIPPQARKLFKQNQCRVIFDTRAIPVPLIGRSVSPSDVDLGTSLLRAVSPIHIQYLDNMGVRSTWAVPVMTGDILWGLASLHRQAIPMHPTPQLRNSVDLAIQILSAKIIATTEQSRLQVKSNTIGFMESLFRGLTSGKNLEMALSECPEALLNMTDSTSVYIRISGQEIFLGHPVESATLANVLAALRNSPEMRIWKSTSLMRDLKLTSVDINAAGALAVPLSTRFEDLVVWFRPEHVHEVDWGGSPGFEAPSGERVSESLTPRASFEIWKQQVSGHCRQWSDSDEAAAGCFLSGFIQGLITKLQGIAQLHANLERLDRMKDEFMSNASHELRTPLSIIIGWIDLIRDEKNLPENIVEAINVIDRNARIQVTMINDLLDTSRMISGKLRLDSRANVDVTEIISGLVAGLSPSAKEKKITINWAPACPVLITADPERLLQIVSNLLNNALKFTPQGGSIAIRLMSGADSVKIEIEDSGIGVAPEQLERIFERFYQTKERGGNGAGLGLGLSLVRGLVELQGGHVCALSQGHGKGTRFVVEVPTKGVRTSESSESSESSVLPPTAVNSPTPARVVESNVLRDVRVLIVEDKEEALIALRAQCESQGAITFSAANGQEALDILMQHPVDLILSDLAMSVVDGYQCMQSWRAVEAKRKSRAIPAIAMSALASPKDKLRAQAAGFNLHIAKPVYREELWAAVRALNLVPNAQRTMDELKSKPA